MRKGLGKNKGKGYRNIIGKDPHVHSQSAKGIKQPLKNPIINKINLMSKSDTLPFKKNNVDVYHLPIETAVYVPSTTTGQKQLSNKDFMVRVKETEKEFAEMFGGYSSVQITGGYVTKNGKVIREKVAKVVIFSDAKSMIKHREKVKSFLVNKKGEWEQESLGYEIEGDLYYIS